MAAGRRFAWQNKPQFAIRLMRVDAANCATVLATLIRPVFSLVRRRMTKIVVFLELNASCRPPGVLASRRRILAHAERVGRPPRLAETASRNHGGAGQRPGTIGQDRGVDRCQYGGRGLLDLCAARR